MKYSIMYSINLMLFAGLFLVTACSSEPEDVETTEEPASVVDAGFVVQRQSLDLVEVANRSQSVPIQVSGRVVPQNTTELYSEVQGVVVSTSKSFKAGTPFSKGEVLLKLDSKEFALNLESQRSAFLNNLTAMMPDLKADYPDNYPKWAAYIRAYELGQPLKVLPPTQSEAEKYFVTANRIYDTYYAIKALEERLEKYTLTAPYNGMITRSNVDIGGLVSPGQLLGTFTNNRQYELEAGVSVDMTAALRIGDTVTFTSNAVSGKWIGRIVRINDMVDPRTQNISVFFAVAGDQLRSGMYLEGYLNQSGKQRGFVIHQSLLARDQSVLVLENEVIARKAVTPIAYLQDSILVTGLHDRAQLIANRFEVPVDGKKVSL